MYNKQSILSIIANFPPELWDWLIPHGPAITSRIDRVSLNPQPLPPRIALQVGAANVAQQIAAAASSAADGAESRLLEQAIEDWCGTPVPGRPIPWPHKWPVPPGVGPRGPQPDPWDLAEMYAVAALAFASISARTADADLSVSFGAASEKLAASAVEVQQVG
ncbi:hypothetical protein [Antrihabitans cavernicola]|uniref:Uncharacterized protein n=1 Tax=Antrihabitans cavernicola TaxID=2495913 RepID=A0A5A7S105_9NOCA|nr:hypothetical protein [Spelaeibacter cavernicola]KAA0016762.1 hypothetical protein FOY51_25795 [Spelaeibacter cavernicola]